MTTKNNVAFTNLVEFIQAVIDGYGNETQGFAFEHCNEQFVACYIATDDAVIIAHDDSSFMWSVETLREVGAQAIVEYFEETVEDDFNYDVEEDEVEVIQHNANRTAFALTGLELSERFGEFVNSGETHMECQIDGINIYFNYDASQRIFDCRMNWEIKDDWDSDFELDYGCVAFGEGKLHCIEFCPFGAVSQMYENQKQWELYQAKRAQAA